MNTPKLDRLLELDAVRTNGRRWTVNHCRDLPYPCDVDCAYPCAYPCDVDCASDKESGTVAERLKQKDAAFIACASLIAAEIIALKAECERMREIVSKAADSLAAMVSLTQASFDSPPEAQGATGNDSEGEQHRMTWAELHAESERLASEAQLAARERKTPEATALYKRAAEIERQALDQVDTSKARTRGITAVSAVALWFKAAEYVAAEQLAYSILADADIPDFAREELRNLVQAIWTERRVGELLARSGLQRLGASDGRQD